MPRRYPLPFALLALLLCGVQPAKAEESAIGKAALTPDERASSAPAACDASALPGVKGGGKIKRYKLTLFDTFTEFDPKTCKPRGSGSFSLISQDRCEDSNCGKVTFGIVAGKPLSSGACPGKTFDFAAICYTWEKHDDIKIDDTIKAIYVPPTVSPLTVEYPARVPIVKPDSEKTNFEEWAPNGYGKWGATLKSNADPKFDWSFNNIRESDPGGSKPSNDGCWCRGSKFDAFYKVTGGQWGPNEAGEWAYDFVGYGSAAIRYYRDKRRAPCGTTLPQQMQFRATKVSQAWSDYGKVETLGAFFSYSEFTSTRAGKSKTQRFNPTAAKSRLACSRITFPDAPAAPALGETVTVDDPRPVAAAVALLQQVASVPIGYEETEATTGRSTPMVRTGSTDAQLLMPKGGRLTVRLPDRASAASVVDSVRAMLSAPAARRASGSFVFHPADGTAPAYVAPAQSPLDAEVTIAAGRSSAMDLLEMLCAALSQAAGARVDVGTVPVNMLRQVPLDSGASNEPARAVLARVIAASGERLSWRLLYDPGTRDYALNLTAVD